jgi:hypothetical protein
MAVVACRWQDHAAVPRLAARRSIAWRVARSRRRPHVRRRAVPSRTIQPESRPREASAAREPSIPHRPRAAVPAGRGLRRPHRRMWFGLPVQLCRSRSGVTADRAAWWSRSPRWRSCPCATEPSPVGRHPRLGRVEIRLGPGWVRYRETATPETDPLSTFHRPVLVPGRHRARSSRLRVTLPRCRPSPWCSPAAMPTSPTYPALAPVRPDPWSSAAAAAQARPGACSGTRPYALPGPAVLHRVAD